MLVFRVKFERFHIYKYFISTNPCDQNIRKMALVRPRYCTRLVVCLYYWRRTIPTIPITETLLFCNRSNHTTEFRGRVSEEWNDRHTVFFTHRILIKIIKMATSAENNAKKIKTFYQTLMALSFSLDTNHKYNRFLRFMIYINIIDWFLSVSCN